MLPSEDLRRFGGLRKLDLLDFPTIIFDESGYSLHTLRQASRRSWRIGQKWPVRVKFMCQEGTM
jgi:hypothetical protein